jgi:hypothetical protein
MKRLAVLFLTLALPLLSWGQLVTFQATLSGTQETPPNASPAHGWATATLNLSTLAFDFDMAFSGLVAPETASHIHVGPIGTAGPVLLPLPLGSPVEFNTTITAAQANDLLNGLWYANVHSTVYPGGEIRGQLLPVPEPSTYGLAAAVLLGAVAIVQRKRRLASR